MEWTFRFAQEADTPLIPRFIRRLAERTVYRLTGEDLTRLAEP